MKRYFGATKDNKTYKGAFGKLLVKENLHKCKVVKFKKVESSLIDDIKNIPKEVSDDFSTDQRLLYGYVMSVHEGKLRDGLENCKAGYINK